MDPLKSRWLTAVTAFLALLFAVFAFLQVNDINPAIYYQPSSLDASSWVLFYGFLSVLFLTSIFRPAPRPLLILAALFCLIEMVRTAPGLYANLFQADQFTMTGASMAPSRAEVELSREFFGSLIGLLGIAFLWWQAVKAKRKSRSAA